MAGCHRAPPATEVLARNYVDGAPAHLETDTTLPSFKSSAEFKNWLKAWDDAEQKLSEAKQARGEYQHNPHGMHPLIYCFKDRYELESPISEIPTIDDKAYIAVDNRLLVVETSTGHSVDALGAISMLWDARTPLTLVGAKVAGSKLFLTGYTYDSDLSHVLEFSFNHESPMLTPYNALSLAGGSEDRRGDYAVVGNRYFHLKSESLANDRFSRGSRKPSKGPVLTRSISERIYSAIKDGNVRPEEPYLHRLRICEAMSKTLSCKYVSILGSRAVGQPLFSANAAYIWLEPEDSLDALGQQIKVPRKERLHRIVKIPYDGSAPRSTQLLGCPSHQAGFQENKGGELVALVADQSGYDATPEARLVQIRPTDFGGAKSEVPARRARDLVWPTKMSHASLVTGYVKKRFVYGGSIVGAWGLPASNVMQASTVNKLALPSTMQLPTGLMALRPVEGGFIAMAYTGGEIIVSYLAITQAGISVAANSSFDVPTEGRLPLGIWVSPEQPSIIALKIQETVSIIALDRAPLKFRTLGEYRFPNRDGSEFCTSRVNVAISGSSLILQDSCRLVTAKLQGRTLKWLPEVSIPKGGSPRSKTRSLVILPDNWKQYPSLRK